MSHSQYANESGQKILRGEKSAVSGRGDPHKVNGQGLHRFEGKTPPGLPAKRDFCHSDLALMAVRSSTTTYSMKE